MDVLEGGRRHTVIKTSIEKLLVYIGSFTGRKSEGISIFRLDASSGGLELVGKSGHGLSCSWIAVDPRKRFLYAIDEVGEYSGRPGGAVCAFSLDPGMGELTYLNRQPSGGAGPCYLSVDGTGGLVFVGNFFGGSLAVLPIQEDGRLGEATDFIQYQGSSVSPRRHEGPHVHSIVPDAANRYIFVQDMGLDKIMVYRLDAEAGKLVPHDPPWVEVRSGVGPRHLVFHPNGRHAYVTNELESTFTAFDYDETTGTLIEAQTVSMLPEDFKDYNICADLHVSPSGRFLYGSNRGHDSIVTFAIDADSGRLSYVDHKSTEGQTPRSFTIDPTETFLLAANQASGTVVSFRIDQSTGRLTPTGHTVEVPQPVSLQVVASP